MKKTLPTDWRRLEINGGRVEMGPVTRLWLPPTKDGYADAQIDDYGGRRRRHYPWVPGRQTSPGDAASSIRLDLEARFSHDQASLIGTAGFGFWNAPFGDPTVPYPTFPQAVWFFFGSPPNDLPLNPQGPGRYFFASTLDAGTLPALALAPAAPMTLVLNRWGRFRQTVWPRIQRRLGISYAPLDQLDIKAWHNYQIEWGKSQTRFLIDGKAVLTSDQSPRGPLGFVCWIDNQYMSVTPTGRMGAGFLPTVEPAWMEIRQLTLNRSQILP